MAETTQKRAREADALDLTEEASPEKKHKVALNAIAEEFICPITQELPVQPVMAEDCKIYEREAIMEWFRKKDGDATSPSTGAVIGTKLLPAVQARNTIESLIQSGAIEGEIAEAWQRASAKKLADETLVKETRAKAEGGDGEAMHRLGVCYKFGLHGVAKDEAQARAWYERSAAARNPKGLASFGDCLLAGTGGPQESVYGIINMTQAAELGSDWGAYRLGKAFFSGEWGIDDSSGIDDVRARFWLKKVVEGECEFKHLCPKCIPVAAFMLASMDAAPAE
jgi:TPR repeat protein